MCAAHVACECGRGSSVAPACAPHEGAGGKGGIGRASNSCATVETTDSRVRSNASALELLRSRTSWKGHCSQGALREQITYIHTAAGVASPDASDACTLTCSPLTVLTSALDDAPSPALMLTAAGVASPDACTLTCIPLTT